MFRRFLPLSFEYNHNLIFLEIKEQLLGVCGRRFPMILTYETFISEKCLAREFEKICAWGAGGTFSQIEREKYSGFRDHRIAIFTRLGQVPSISHFPPSLECPRVSLPESLLQYLRDIGWSALFARRLRVSTRHRLTSSDSGT